VVSCQPCLNLYSIFHANKIALGRSTLQNELVSDLTQEFKHLPEGVESYSLREVAVKLQSTHPKGLENPGILIIDKLISTKMPLNWGLKNIRAYIASRWGFGPHRQNAVLLMAATAQPSARLDSANAVENFLQGIIDEYAAHEGTTFEPQDVQAVAKAGHLEKPSQESPQSHRQMEAIFIDQILQRYDKFETNEKLQEARNINKSLQQRLDIWQNEFSAEFETGIMPLFFKKKVRRYASSWNNVRMELVKLYYEMLSTRLNDPRKTIISDLSAKVMDSSGPLVESMMRTMVERIGIEQPNNNERLGESCICHVDFTGYKYQGYSMVPRATISERGEIEVTEIPRENDRKPWNYADLVQEVISVGHSQSASCTFFLSRHGNGWKYDEQYTALYHSSVKRAMTTGLSFRGKDVLVTGAGPGSIAIEVVKGLLMGGARVIMTTSRPVCDAARSCQQIYERYGSDGAELLLVPFNQGSAQDCNALVDYVYSKDGLGRSLDIVLPFAAISDYGKEIDRIDAWSELTHRLMLVNVIRFLGAIVQQKRSNGFITRPTVAVLPLSSNHGIFGGDSLYAESKIALETLLRRCECESWSDYLSICGAIIGWTRGTGLTDSNKLIASTIEKEGAFTFSTSEMALNILAILSDTICVGNSSAPHLVDLNGGLHLIQGLKSKISQAREELLVKSAVKKIIATQDAIEEEWTDSKICESSKSQHSIKRSNLSIGFPKLPRPEIKGTSKTTQEQETDLTNTIVVVGFSELGPWGGARTRWERELRREFSMEGFVELAWSMNLIKHVNSTDRDGNPYIGWVDVLSGIPVRDDEIETKYAEYISKNTGIRKVDPDIHGGYNAEQRKCLHEIILEEDLPGFDTTEAVAKTFKAQHGDRVAIWQAEKGPNHETFTVQLKRGATVMVPKSSEFNSKVAGQIPRGFDPRTYGVPEEIVSQVDPTTLYALVCFSEALYSAGITDSYEIFKHIHLSEFGLFLGSSFGGMKKTHELYKDSFIDRLVAGDVLQEAFPNTPSAWINMLLLGGCGPIKTPTGACATSVESIDAACESIRSNKTKMCLVGGVDDLSEESAYGFSSMKATIDAKEELDRGRLPAEMSRPMAESRAGFVESHGCGMQILCRADVALEMGLPIYAILAGSAMAADGLGRSIPAPGQGILSFARDTESRSPMTNSLESCVEVPRENDTASTSSAHGPGPTITTPPSGTSDTQSTYSGQNFGSSETRRLATFASDDLTQKNRPVSPCMRSALSAWGLDVNDIDMVSMHGTSTRANDINEAQIIHHQLDYLGRIHGLPVPVVCQKSLTGHPKAAAAAWMLNGCLQAMTSSRIPGNQTLDSVDEELKPFYHLVFPTQSLHAYEIKSFLLSSFGFGQKAGQILGVAPQYLFQALSEQTVLEYVERRKWRQTKAKRDYSEAMATNSIVKVKSSPPFQQQLSRAQVYLDASARFGE
jgi:fatty acid synthase subunit alpha, fungi type